jgi:VIT1/CCC1 family predicted Fe2+/Mn2+ transporter
MKQSWLAGISFGVTSGVITTLGLMVGLHAGTHSRQAVIGGILTIAIADALSDALGIHVSRESDAAVSAREVWISTVATFLSKLVFALTFLVPVLLLELTRAVWVSVGWGLALLASLSWAIARAERERPAKVVAEHVSIGLAVIGISHLVGEWISTRFT